MRIAFIRSLAALIVLFYTIIYFQACKTSPPVEPALPAQYGYLVVNADIDSAKIFIDSVNTGRFAPDTIKLATGPHIVQLYRSGYAVQEKKVQVSINRFETASFMYSTVADSGYIDISSNLASGYTVKVDGIICPGSIIKLRTGTHTVTFEKSGYISDARTVFIQKDAHLPVLAILTRKLVIVEDFSNASCQYCVPMNQIIEALKSNTFNETRAAVIQCHTNFPMSSDPMYLEAPAILTNRYMYYSVYSAPTLVVDGTTKISERDSILIRDSLNSHLAVTTVFAVNAKLSVAGTTATTDIDVYCKDTAGINFQNLVVHTVLLESLVEFATPPGSYGEKEFHNVLRAMPSGTGGKELGQMYSYGKTSFQVTADIKSSWNSARLRAVVYIQDKVTKKIYQGAWND